MGFYKDRWIAHYERAIADREFQGLSPKQAERLAAHDADKLLADSLADEVDMARMRAKDGIK